MVIFILNILLLVFYGIRLKASALTNSTQRLVFLVIAFLHLSFLHIFFDKSKFPDLPGYITYFDSLSNSKPVVHLEVGWFFLNKILHVISHDSFVLILSVSVIIVLCYLITINRYSAIPWLSVFLLLCTVFYNSLFVLRQHVAIPLCLLSIPYIIERKPVKFTLLTLLAVSFHWSALIWFLAYFIYPLKISKSFYVVLIVFSVLLYFSMDIILKKLTLLTSNIMAYTVSPRSGGAGVLKGAAVNISTFILCLFSFGKQDKITGYNKLFFQLIIINIFLNFLEYFRTSFALFGRLNLYFFVLNILLIPNALSQISNKKNLYILIPLICFLYLLFLNHMFQYGYKIRL